MATAKRNSAVLAACLAELLRGDPAAEDAQAGFLVLAETVRGIRQALGMK